MITVAMSTTTRSDSAKRAIHLTKREVEVLSLLAQNHSPKKTADALYVAPKTVSWHLGNIYDKLQVENCTQALLAAGRMGLIPIKPVPFDAHVES